MRGFGQAVVALAVSFAVFGAGVGGTTCAVPPPGTFNVPAGLPTDPPGPVFIMHIGMMQTIIPYLGLYETPIVIRTTSMLDSLTWNAVAVFTDGAKDALTKKAPWVNTVPAEYQEYPSEAQALTALYSWFGVLEELIPNEELIASMNAYAASLGLQPEQTIPDAIVDCSKLKGVGAQRNCFNDIACANGFTPQTIGLINAQMARKYLARDGWNGDGSKTKNGKRCTANCTPFSDITDYSPVNWPGVSGLEHHWRPLLEDDGKGFFFRQEHVTPHIGFTAKPRVISRKYLAERNEELMDANYDYDVEADLAIERLANIDDSKKMTIEFFNDKIAVALNIFNALFAKHQDMTFARFALFFVGFTGGEYDAILQSWRAKVTTDLVRPTTVVQGRNGGRDEITTYAGPYAGTQTIKAANFQPYVRTMPHSEYPSATGCVCQVLFEYVTEFEKYFWNDQSELTVVVPAPAGSSKIEPGATPGLDLNLVFSGMAELKEVCGQSRLDGGMHFTASVDAAYKLCEGTGRRATRYVRKLANGTNV